MSSQKLLLYWRIEKVHKIPLYFVWIQPTKHLQYSLFFVCSKQIKVENPDKNKMAASHLNILYPSSLLSMSGGSIRLHCSVTNVEDRGVSWIRLSDYQILTNGLKTFTSDRRFKLLHSSGSSEWTLELVSVQQRDEGGYQCQVPKKFKKLLQKELSSLSNKNQNPTQRKSWQLF